MVIVALWYVDCNSMIKVEVTELVLELQAHKTKIKGVLQLKDTIVLLW